MKPHLRNVGSLLASDAGSRVIGFFVTAYLARVLGPGGFGVLSIGLAVLGHLAVLGSPGMQVVEARNVAAQREGLTERVGGVLAVRLVLAVFLVGLTALVSGTFVRSESLRDVIVLYACSLFPYALLLDWYFQGKEDFLRLGFSRLLMYVFFGFGVLALVRAPADVRMAPLAFLIGNAVAVLFLGISYVTKTRGLPFTWAPGQWMAIIRENLPVGVALLLAQLVSNFPPLVVGFFLDEQQVGMYSAALKLVFFILVLDRLFNALFLPVATRYWATKGEELPLLVRTMVKGIVILTLPIITGAFLLAPDIIRITFGTAFVDAVPLFRLMLGFVLLTMLNSVFVCLLVASGNEHRYTWSMTWGTCTLALAVIALTPLAGTIGSSWALVIGEGATLMLMIHNSRTVTQLPSAGFILRPLLGCVAMAFVYWILEPTHSLLALVAGLIVYGVVVIAASALSREEFRFLRERLT